MMGLSASVNEHLMCGINQKEYLENIKFLVEEKKKLQKQQISSSTISLQVTVCKKNWSELPSILEFAEKEGIDRVKWNKAVFLSGTNESLKKEYQLDEEGSDFEEWKQMACFIQKKAKIRVEGSFFDLEKREPSKDLNAFFR
jgi:MoaA/NifB/PqqE/SkfB family radical SAM enzyme